MIRHASRPRAPSPPRQSSASTSSSSQDSYIYNDSENTYSVVQDSVTSSPPPPPPKKRLHGGGETRMFGDSVTPSPAGSVLIPPPKTHSLRRTPARLADGNESLHQLYHLKNRGPGEGSIYDGATVEQIKAQFQKQIENMLQGQETHHRHHHSPHPPPPGQLPPKLGSSLHRSSAPIPIGNHRQPLRNGHIQSTGERMLSDIKDLPRGQSFLEARSAVQKQIERIFSDTTSSPTTHPKEIKHTMHGVSHALPGQDEEDFEPPPPVHYGVNQAAIQHGSAALRPKRGTEDLAKWRSVESVLKTTETESMLTNLDMDEGRTNRFHRSMESVQREMRSKSPRNGTPGLPRSNALDIDIGDPELMDRLRAFEQTYPTNEANRDFSPNRSPTDRPSPSMMPFSDSASSSSRYSAHVQHISTPSPKQALQKEYVKHKVDYLGALPISHRSTNLSTLQEPLKDLYFKYRALRNLGQSNLPGTLEINDTGLTIQYIRELHKGVQEIFNPFATIAVWAAVKFVHRRDVTPIGTMHHQYAFLPLISDPDGDDKQRLFHDLDINEVELAADSPHPPVFACVMRRAGSPKKLECHGFVCASSEDAIIVAANLYQALLETMKKQKNRSKSSRASSVQDDELTPPPAMFSDSDTTTPVRPPRTKKKKSGKGTSESSVIGRSSLINSSRRRSSIRSNRSGRLINSKKPTVTYNPTGRSRGPLGRADWQRTSIRSNASSSKQVAFRRSARYRSGGWRPSNGADIASSDSTPSVSGPYGGTLMGESTTDRGDVYTKVAIPRSKSFMNVNSQYNLQELFRELKEKEGVESIDDVLKKVITSKGISFNEIKPVYRELLLKLAMTMSQDELFERSKTILTQEKKKSQKLKSSAAKKAKSSSVTGSEQNTLSSFLRMTFSGNKNGPNNRSNSNSLSQVEKNNKRNSKNPLSLSTPSLHDGSPNSSWKKSSSGYDSASPHNRSFMSGSIGNGLASSHVLSKSHSTLGKISKADISGPIPIKSQSPMNTIIPSGHSQSKPFITSSLKKPPQSRSAEEEDDSVDDAYMSCSECGYESVCTYDTCSCRVSIPPPREYQAGPIHSSTGPFAPMQKMAGKPLPSLPRSVLRPQAPPEPDSDIYCDCDAQSCVSEEKCYCSLRGHPEPQGPLKPRRTPLQSHPKHHGEALKPACHHEAAIVSHMRLPNNTTIIHCNGSDSLRSQHAQSTVSTSSNSSQCSSCMTCDSGSTATDTTCYSIRHQNISLSNCETPQTAWRRNNIRILQQKTSPCSDRSTCSDYSTESPLSRKNSGGSGYHSNDSFTLPQHEPPPARLYIPNPAKATRTGGSKAASMCGSSSCSSSGTSSCSQRSSSSDGRKSAASKVLLISAHDRQGKVLYRGASNSNLDKIHPAEPLGEDKSIMSMKKSAEIAAVFSGARINQTTNIVDNIDSDLDSTDLVYDTKRSSSNGSSCRCGSNNFSRANMGSSLGYFP